MDDETRKKKLLMKLGIASLMFLILFFWILNIKNVFKNNPSAENIKDQAQWQDLKTDLGKTVDKMSESLDKISETNEKLKNASSSEAQDNIATSTETSTETSTSTDASIITIPVNFVPDIKRTDCPPYINCMPSIGEARQCEIPIGCEGITELVY